jgi:hypothetical protein
VDDAKRQSRFQFSLRKLMLWMTVWAVYLAFFVPWVGVPLTVVVAIYLAVIAVIRLKWGQRLGLPIAAVVTAVGWGCFGLLHFLTGGGDSVLVEILVFVWFFATGSGGGLIAFGLVHGLVYCVDSLDDWMRTRTQNH